MALTGAEYTYEGNWMRGYCCSGRECDGLAFCSDGITNDDLMKLTCPVNDEVCPSDDEGAIMVVRSDGEAAVLDRTWTQFNVRQETACRVLVKHEGALSTDSDRFKYDKISIKVETADNTVVKFMVASDQETLTNDWFPVSVGATKTVSIEPILRNQGWWLMYEPEVLYPGSIRIRAYVESQDMAEDEIAAILAAEEAAREAEELEEEIARQQAEAAAAQAELERQQELVDA